MNTQIVKFESSFAEPYPLQVEGESHYRENLEYVSGYTGDDEGVNEDTFTALLILEDDNVNDENAVRVEIENKQVGYLSKPNAKKYRQKLQQLNIPTATGQCYASIRGGFSKRDGSQADFGVRLDMIIDELSIYKTPVKIVSVLPPVPAPVSIQPKQQPKIMDQIKSLFAPGQWWKTLLIIFIGIPFILPLLCGIIQGILEVIAGK